MYQIFFWGPSSTFVFSSYNILYLVKSDAGVRNYTVAYTGQVTFYKEPEKRGHVHITGHPLPEDTNEHISVERDIGSIPMWRSIHPVTDILDTAAAVVRATLESIQYAFFNIKK